MKNKVAIFPGTFDPFTLGHHDIVLRGLKIFDTIHIAIGNNPEKERYFDIELIKNKIKELYKDENKINIILYNELTAEISKKLNANFILRGLRNTTDFEFENSNLFINTLSGFACETSSFIENLNRKKSLTKRIPELVEK